jgi:putative transposase
VTQTRVTPDASFFRCYPGSLPVKQRARLVSDNGPSYVAGAFDEYLRMHLMRHIRCSPHHPQTNGKLEWFHVTL